MYRHGLLLFLAIFLVAIPYAKSQGNLNPANINVSELSEAQVQSIYDQMNSRGLTQQQAESLAKSRGFSQGQIQELRQRFQELDGGQSVKPTMQRKQYVPADLEGDTTYFGNFSTKKDIDVSTKEERLFGFDFFNTKNLTFEPSDNLPMPDSYAIGIGDKVIIDIWGKSEQSYYLMVERNGSITVPGAGPVAVAGLTLSEARKKIHDKLGLIYSDLISEKPSTFANIYLGYIKPIKVNVVGEVFAPGSYTLPGVASAFNALYLSGGPNINGSFRNIKVIRDGEVVATLDVYQYLVDGKNDVNMTLRDGDLIMVPAYEKRIKIGGELKRTGIFEAKEGDLVSDILKYAGGFTDKAYTHRIELYRNDSRQIVYKDIEAASFDQVELVNGDSIFAGQIIGRIENRVSIDGAVMRPGNYELSEDMTLARLLENAEGLRKDAFLERGQVLRLDDNLQLETVPFDVKKLVEGEFDMALEREDLVHIYSMDSLRQRRYFTIRGEVQKPGRFGYRDGTTLADLIAYAGGLRETAASSYIEVARRLSHEEASDYQRRTGHLYQFTISRNLNMDDTDSNFELQPFDQVFVRKAPGFSRGGSVQVDGEVLYSGEYHLNNREERLSTIIERAGGLTPDAFPSGAMLTRETELDKKEIKLREQLQERDQQVKFDDTDFNVLAIDLEAALENPGSRDDVFLHAGDELFIPRELQTVRVGGEVLNPINTSHIEGKGLKFYVNQTGGFTDMSKKSRAYVIYPNGKAAATKNYVLFKNYPKILPGSEIIIPRKPEKNPMPPTAWITIGSGVASMALTIATIVNVLN